MEFDPFSEEFFNDPYDIYRWLRDENPTYHNEKYGFWALSRFDDVVRAHRDWKSFSSEHGLTIDQLTSPDTNVRGTMIITMDPPEHDRMRKLVSRVFTPRAMTALEPMIREVIVSYLSQYDDANEFDALADFAAPFPVEVISIMLGVPKEDQQQIRHWTDAMLTREEGSAAVSHESAEAGLAQVMYFLQLIADKRVHPGDDMLTRLTEVEVAEDDGSTHQLTNDEIAGFATLLAAAGSETVTKLIGNAVVLFARNPQEWSKVLADPGRCSDAVEEVLRYWAPSQYQGRFTHAPIEFNGVTIPANEPVLLLTGAANRDEREYPDPDRFDIDRRQGLAVGLGHGIHSCLGAALARAESRIAFEEIRLRWPKYEVDESGLRRVKMSNVAGYSSVPVMRS